LDHVHIACSCPRGLDLLQLRPLSLGSLTVSLGSIVAIVDNKIFRSVVVAAREIALENGLGTSCVALLSIDRSTRHMRDHSVAAAPWVLGVSERMLLGSRLREPDITTVAVELTRLEGLCDIFLDDNGATGSVDEPSTCEDMSVLCASQPEYGGIPFFILEISSLLNRPRVFSWRGQLMVTISH
jgi:hypothetical protein